MKFALNGALTIGTMDGANVEIYEQVGAKNIFIFGMNVDEVNALRAKGYNPHDAIEANPYLKRALDLIRNDFFSPAARGIFQPLIDTMNYDYYMVAADFASYMKTQEEMAQLYRNPSEWTKRCIHNIANMGTFAEKNGMDIRNPCRFFFTLFPRLKKIIFFENPACKKRNICYINDIPNKTGQ